MRQVVPSAALPSEEGRGVDTDVVFQETGKWSGITAAGGTAVAAPSHANKRFPMDIETEEVRGVDTNVVFKGMGKWRMGSPLRVGMSWPRQLRPTRFT